MSDILSNYKHPLSNFDILKIIHEMNIKHFRNVFMIDELPTKPNDCESGIVNLDTSDHAGTHWICYFKKGNQKFVFDSFGGDVPEKLVNYLGASNLFYNAERIQMFDEYICGHLCVLVLKLFSNLGSPNPANFNEIIDLINGHIWK